MSNLTHHGKTYGSVSAMLRAKYDKSPKTTPLDLAPSGLDTTTVTLVLAAIEELERIHDEIWEMGRANEEAGRTGKQAFYDRFELQEELRSVADALRFVPGIPTEVARSVHRLDRERSRRRRTTPFQASIRNLSKVELQAKLAATNASQTTARKWIEREIAVRDRDAAVSS